MKFDVDLVRTFFQTRADQAQNTLFKHATALRGFARWGIRRGYWLRDPMLEPEFKFKMGDTLPKPFHPEELDRLMAIPLAGVEQVGRALLFHTALRIGAICGLRVSDLNFAPLVVEDAQLPGSITLLRGNKGGKKQLIPMSEELHEILLAWVSERPDLKPYDPVLHHGPDRRPYGRSTVEAWVRAWGKEAKVVGATPHRFRHSAATDMLRRGVALEIVQRVLGHVAIATTQRYNANFGRLGDPRLVRRTLFVRSPSRPTPASEPEFGFVRI